MEMRERDRERERGSMEGREGVAVEARMRECGGW
jgi:hypothetical protein